MLPAISINKVSHHITAAPKVSPEGTQDRNGMPPHQTVTAAATPHPPPPPSPMVHPEGTQDEKTQDSGPAQLRCISKGKYQK